MWANKTGPRSSARAGLLFRDAPMTPPESNMYNSALSIYTLLIQEQGKVIRLLQILSLLGEQIGFKCPGSSEISACHNQLLEVGKGGRKVYARPFVWRRNVGKLVGAVLDADYSK